MTSELDVGMRCIKYMLFVTNFMFSMIGFLLISIGTTVNTIYSDFDLFLDNSYFSPSGLFVAIGVIMFFVSLFGCIGAFRQSVLLVNIYGGLLFIILILELSAAIAAYSMRGEVESYIEQEMGQTLNRYMDEDETVKPSWDFMQSRLECCGVHFYKDWEMGISQSKAEPKDDFKYIPASCFRDEPDYTELTNLFNNGCMDKLHYIVVECAQLIGTGGICVAVVQILGIIFANMLAKSIRRMKTDAERERQEERMRMYASLAQGRPDQKVTPVLYVAPEMDA